MDTADSKFVIKLLPNLVDVTFLMPLVFLFGRMEGLVNLLADGDTGWHIRTGQWILSAHSVPYRDLFSFSKPNSVWYAWEWLSDVLFAGLNAIGGLAAVALFAIVLLAAVFTMVFRMARRKSNAVVAVVVVMVAMAASSVHWLARPHMFTLLFVAIFANALDRVREGHTKIAGIPWLVLLPVMTVVWTNLHGGFLVGVVMVAIFGVAELLQVLLAAQPEGRAAGLDAGAEVLSERAGVPGGEPAESVHLPSACASSGSICAIPILSEHIMEFLLARVSISPAAIFFEIMLAGGVLAAAWYVRRGSYAEPLLIVLWATRRCWRRGNIPIFTILAAPMVAAAANAGLRSSAGCAGCVVVATHSGAVQPHHAGNQRNRRSSGGGTLPAWRAWRWWRRCCTRPTRRSRSGPNSIRSGIPLMR